MQYGSGSTKHLLSKQDRSSTIVMASQSSFQQYARTARHFASTRAPEVLALQASPILGVFLGGISFERENALRLGLLLFGSLALTAHIFIFNDWVELGRDSLDARRAKQVFTRQGIRKREVAHVLIVLLIFASFCFALLSGIIMLIGAAIAILGFLYSDSLIFGKRAPIVGSINHLLGGSLHFLLGYTLSHALDINGLAISLFFGLVFAGGHLNHEVRDYEGDLQNGIRTSAVVFGCRRTFLASMCIFTAAYAILVGLAALGILPKLLFLSPILWLLHVTWFIRMLPHKLGFETAIWIQRRYRLLFALIGGAIILARCYEFWLIF